MAQSEKGSAVNRAKRIGIVAALAVAVVVVAVAKSVRNASLRCGTGAQERNEAADGRPGDPAGGSSPAAAPVPVSLPRLVDLGADKCIPCKMMKPILDELRRDYDGVFEVVFIDVWKDKGAGKAHGIRVIPTQIFFDGSGNELFRHEGFYSKGNILNKWRELGVDVEKTKEERDEKPSD